MGIFIDADRFDPAGNDELDPDYPFLTVARSESSSEREGDPVWIDDFTMVTNGYGVALAWAYYALSVSDDGENPKPLARIRAYQNDPLDGISEDDEPGSTGRVVAYVSNEHGVVTPDDDVWDVLDASVREWDEIIKALRADDEDEEGES